MSSPPAARLRYGLARWIWFRSLTRLAWLLALRDSYPTTELAGRAAIAAVETYGSPRAARKAVRTVRFRRSGAGHQPAAREEI